MAGDCVPGGEAPGAIADVLDRLSGPTTLPCFLASLPRPLPVVASADVFSAQPAVGERSPRLLLHRDGLTMTVVPEGPGVGLLELGEDAGGGLSVKAEIAFPVDGPLDEAAPYDRVREPDGGTGCGVCHGGEVAVGAAYASRAIRPLPERVVPLDQVAAEASACGEAADPRCAVLRAVFGHGEVVAGPLPASWPTLYDAR
ncbi:MAG: hypothetical protein R3F59_26365 [Myxococcota bacterium]